MAGIRIVVGNSAHTRRVNSEHILPTQFVISSRNPRSTTGLQYCTTEDDEFPLVGTRGRLIFTQSTCDCQLHIARG